MITDDDIKKLKKAFREEFVTKQEHEDLVEATRKGFEDMNRRFIEVDNRFLALDAKFTARFDHVLSAIDALIVRTDRYFQEHTMLGNKVDRHEKWIEHIATETDVTLPEA